MAVKTERPFRVFPEQWAGVRNDIPAMVIDYKEWQDARNMDARFGFSGAGSTLLATLDALNSRIVTGVFYYYDQTGAIHLVSVLENGDIYDDGVKIGPSLGAGSTLFADNFNRIDGDPGDDWTVVGGTWGIVQRQLALTYPNMGVVTLDGMDARTDMSVEAWVDNTATASIPTTHLYFRYVDATNWYRVRISKQDGIYSATATLEKSVSGTVTGVNYSSGTGTIPNLPCKIKAVIQGSVIRVYANGNLVGTATDTGVSAAGTIGFGALGGGSMGGYFIVDDLVVTDPAATVSDPLAAAGIGSLVIARGIGKAPIWRDPSDSTWKDLTATSGTLPLPSCLTIDPAGPRLFVAPVDADSPDTWAWCAPGEFKKWAVEDGGGSEPVGEDRERITAIRSELGNNIAIYKANHIYVRQGSDPTSWSLDLVSSDLGATAPLSVVKIGKGHFFVHESGAYFLNAIGSVSFPALTARVQKTWDAMVEQYGAYLKYAHASYHPRENMVYLWVPNAPSRVMGTLLKFYVPTGAITIHDDKPASHSAFKPTTVQRIVYGSTDSKTFTVEGLTNDSENISSHFRTGVYSGSPPSPEIEKRWGNGGRLHLFFESNCTATVTVTPTIYRKNEIITGTPQNVTLTANQVTKATVHFPDDMGWGFDLLIQSTQGLGTWRTVGYAGIYTEITDA